MYAPVTTHAKRAQRRFLAVMGAVSVLSLGLLASPLQAGERGLSAAPQQVVEAQGRVIVKYRAGAAALRATAYAAKAGPQQALAIGQRLGLNLQDGRALSERSQVLMAPGLSSAALVQALAQHPDVEWVVEDRRRFVRAVPNDPLFSSNQTTTTPVVGQWYLRAPDTTFVSAINAQAAWDRTKGVGKVVAVLDTGIRPNHPDLQGKLLPGYDFVGYSAPATNYSTADALAYANDGDLADADPSDPGDWLTAAEAATTRFEGCEVSSSSWHGTQVAGLIAASTNNGVGMAGAAWDAKVLPVRVLGKCGGFDSEIIAGMKWAAGLTLPGIPSNSYPAKVINLSLGSSGACGAAYTEVIAQLAAVKATVVVAAGNEGLAVGAPANCAGVVSVAGVRHAGTKVGYSNLGPEVTLAAPAGNCGQDTGPCLYALLSTADTGSTTPVGPSYTTSGADATIGTSFAAPLVSATVSLMQAINPEVTPAQVIAALRSTARAFPSSGAGAGVAACQAPGLIPQDSECYCTTSTCGAGLLNAAAAVAAMSGAAPTASFTVSPASPQIGVNVLLNGQSSTAAAGRTLTAYQWAITSGSTLASFTGATNTATATLSPVAAGTVTVQLTVTDDLGSSHVSSQTVTIGSTPPPQPVLESGGGSSSPLALGVLALCAVLLGRRRRV